MTDIVQARVRAIILTNVREAYAGEPLPNECANCGREIRPGDEIWKRAEDGELDPYCPAGCK